MLYQASIPCSRSHLIHILLTTTRSLSIHLVHDDTKDKEFELELSWIGPETNGRHVSVPRDLWAEADRKAREALDADMED
jgi:hypothetical protein